MADDLFREIIIDRYKNPQNRGKVDGGQIAMKANLSCGDKLEISAKVKNGIIDQIKFEGGGCAVSMAAVDLLCDKLRGMKVEDAKKLTGEDIEEMLGVELTYSRKKCANLGLEVAKKVVG
jgi:nitrogen fixation NifU-like protein